MKITNMRSFVLLKILLAAFSMAVLPSSLDGQEPEGRGENPRGLKLTIGDKFPDLGQIDWVGKAPAGLKEDLLLIDFFFTTCGPCIRKMPEIVGLHEKYSDSGLSVVCITWEDKSPALVAFKKKHGRALDFGCDPQREVIDEFGVRGYPTTVLVRNGRILWLRGPSSRTLEEAVDYHLGRIDEREPHIGIEPKANSLETSMGDPHSTNRLLGIQTASADYFLNRPTKEMLMVLDVYHKGELIKTRKGAFSRRPVRRPIGSGKITFHLVDHSRSNIQADKDSGFFVYYANDSSTGAITLEEDEYQRGSSSSVRGFYNFEPVDGCIPLFCRIDSPEHIEHGRTVKELVAANPRASMIVVKFLVDEHAQEFWDQR